MEITAIVNNESLIFMGLSAFSIFLSQNFGWRSIVLLDDLIIPIGIIGTLIGLVMMLGSEENLEAIPGGVFAALTPTLYALAIKGLISERQDFVELNSGLSSKLMGLMGLLSVIGYTMEISAGVSAFLDLNAFIFVLSAIVLTAIINLIKEQPILAGLQKRLAGVGLLGLLIGITLMLPDFYNPKSLGPAVAFSYLSLMYAMLMLVILRILIPDQSWKDGVASPINWLTLGLPFFIGLAVSIALLLASHLSL